MWAESVCIFASENSQQEISQKRSETPCAMHQVPFHYVFLMEV